MINALQDTIAELLQLLEQGDELPAAYSGCVYKSFSYGYEPVWEFIARLQKLRAGGRLASSILAGLLPPAGVGVGVAFEAAAMALEFVALADLRAWIAAETLAQVQWLRWLEEGVDPCATRPMTIGPNATATAELAPGVLSRTPMSPAARAQHTKGVSPAGAPSTAPSTAPSPAPSPSPGSTGALAVVGVVAAALGVVVAILVATA